MSFGCCCFVVVVVVVVVVEMAADAGKRGGGREKERWCWEVGVEKREGKKKTFFFFREG